MAWWEVWAWDWAPISKTVVGAGVGTAVVQGAISLYRDRRDKRLQAAYIAMRVAVILEEFVVKCVHRAWHDQADLNEGAIELSYELPTLSQYPQESDWKSLDPKLAGRALSFPNELTSANMSCQFQGTREGNKTASATETVDAGVRAWVLAQDLRRKYRLDAVTIDHVDLLEAEQKRLEQHRKHFAASGVFPLRTSNENVTR